MHVSLTASLLMLNPLGISGAHLLTYSLALAGALWVIAVVAARSGWHVAHRPPRSAARPA
jgi:hypothetical protein